MPLAEVTAHAAAASPVAPVLGLGLVIVWAAMLVTRWRGQDTPGLWLAVIAVTIASGALALHGGIAGVS
jgi:uncharacterized membrane protein YhaH (DUF805 family)